MGQSQTDVRFPISAIFLLAAASLFFMTGCDRSDRSVATTQADAALPASQGVPRIASLVPAATDLLLAMGARDRLVAVSTFDQAADVQRLPRVGDYQQVDWESLAAARPTAMIVQMRADRMPAGLTTRAAAMGVSVCNVSVETVGDVFALMDQLGALADDGERGAVLGRSLRTRLNAVEAKVRGTAAVPVLLTIDLDPKAVVGRGPFLDELLTLAGGRNVVAGTYPHWPTLDAETLASLAPATVIALLPGASPQAVEQAKANVARIAWATAPRVVVLTEPTLLQPGSHIADLAESMAAILHP